MNLKNRIYLLLMLLATFLPISCSDNNDIVTNPSSDDDKIHLNIGVYLPGASSSETRAFGNENYTFNDLYVAVFVEIDGVSYLDEFVRADNTVPTWNETTSCWDFGVTLTKTNDTEGRRLHIIANYPGLTMGFGEEGQLIGRLLAKNNDHDVYWNFCNVTSISEEAIPQLQKIPLLRNYAKIQLKVPQATNSKFKLNRYALYNVPAKGTVATYNPAAKTTGDKFAKFADFVTMNGQVAACKTYSELLAVEKYEGNEPFDDGNLISTSINWVQATTNEIQSPIYMYERSNRSASNPTCMLIEGYFASDGNFEGVAPSYYKLDFVYEDDETHAKVYYNLLRNFVYTMTINNVKAEGYNSIEEAIKQPASNNIGGDAVAKEYTNISDGTGRLFVSSTYMLLTSNQDAFVYYKYISNVNSGTINNDLVTVTAPAGPVLRTAAVPAGEDETAGLYVGWRKVMLYPNNVPDASVSQELIFAETNGELQREVELVLRKPYRFIAVEVTPELVGAQEKASVTVKITLPSGIAPSLFPLRLFINSRDNTIFPAYGSNMPAEAQDGRYGFIREVSLNEYNESKEITCNFLTNCAESATMVYVDNVYFEQGYDSFGNSWKNSVTLGTTTGVEIEMIYGRYPRNIYYTGGNTGTEQVTVKMNGSELNTTITIDRNNVTQGITFTNTEGLSKNDVVEFTFTDNYWYGQWSNTPITYKATSTLGDIDAGTTLVFTAQGEINKLTRLEITTSQRVSVQKDGNGGGRYPEKIYNNGTNTGTEYVTVKLRNGTTVGTIYIDGDNVTQGAVLENSNGFNFNDELIFTFSDRYGSGSKNWNGPATYTATCTVEQLLNGVTLNFGR